MNNRIESCGDITVDIPKPEKLKKKVWRQFVKRTGKCLSPPKEDKDKWLKEMRANLGLMATVITTMSFQMILNPPGGVMSIRDDANSSSDYNNCNFMDDGVQLCPGKVVLAATNPDAYFEFLVSNTICIVASLSVCLLLVSGIL
ncbi:hypothetical protein P8452_73473 [Trifolium repens]|jgi:hypothetical protein|nr:hypothetical protein P8452_73473 [Trifolium repens]